MYCWVGRCVRPICEGNPADPVDPVYISVIASKKLNTADHAIPKAPSSHYKLSFVPSYFERFMAWRYLRGAQGRAEGRRFLRFITYVAIGGVAVGVAALLLALSIVRGFGAEIESKIMGFGSHIQVRALAVDDPLDDADAHAEELRAYDDVQQARPVVESFVLLRRSAEAVDGVALFGTDTPPEFMAERIVDGDFDFTPDEEGRPGIVVGQQLADRLGLSAGERVTLFAMQSETAPASNGGLPRPQVREFYVAGIYETAIADIDDLYVFADLQETRSLVGFPEDAVSRFDVTLHDTDRIDSMADRIETDTGYPLSTRTIYQQYQGLFAWVDLQQSIVPIIIGAIILVAAFNIIATLLMMILEKTREVGVLGSLGASGKMLQRLFLSLGILIGVVGTAIGEGLALTLGYIQQRFGVISLPAEAYYMDTAPIQLHPFDFLLVGVIALILCAAAAYVPARVASRIEPVQAIRFE